MSKRPIVIFLVLTVLLLSLAGLYKLYFRNSVSPTTTQLYVGASESPINLSGTDYSFNSDPKETLLYYSEGKPIRSSSWWKHVAVNGCNNTLLFPDPLIMELRNDSIKIGYQSLEASKNTVFLKRDFQEIIGMPNVETCNVVKSSELGADLVMGSKDGESKLTIIKGVPYIKIQTSNVLAELKENIAGTNLKKFVKKLTENSYLVGIIPQEVDESTLSDLGHPTTNIISTATDLALEIDFIGSTLFTYPEHAYAQNLPDYGAIGLKGKYQYKLDSKHTITYKKAAPVVFPEINMTIDEKSELEKLVKESYGSYIKKKDVTEGLGVYWAGKEIGKVSNLIYLSHILNLAQEEKDFIEILSTELTDWANYSGEADTKFFNYSSSLGSLIASPSKNEYGNDNLNDHHFHYGYYIYGLATLQKYAPEKAGSFNDFADYLIRDIASFNPKDPSFPFLRHFDLYDGYSHASGLTYFGDGNNQESSSEAINSWYSAYMWYQLSNQPKLADLYLFGYLSEVNATNTYFFNTKNSANIFPEKYTHQIRSINWEGKADFATWFSADPNAIHGIQVLPITWGSLYLVHPADYVQMKYDSQKVENKNNFETWNDLNTIYYSLNNVGGIHTDNSELDSGNTKAWYYFAVEILPKNKQLTQKNDK